MTQRDPWLTQFDQRREEREKEDRSFEFLGETLTHKASIAPEVGMRLGAFQRRGQEHERVQQERIARGEEREPLDVDDDKFLELCEWTIRSCLEPESIEAWERIRAPEFPHPMNWNEIYLFATYIQAKASGVFPTDAPTSSSDGQSSSASTSKAGSRSPAVRTRKPRVVSKRT